jgi:hypothetical protein
MRCMHPPPLSLLPVPEPKALEPESQEPEYPPPPHSSCAEPKTQRSESPKHHPIYSIGALLVDVLETSRACDACISPSLSLPPVPKPKALESESQEPESTPFPAPPQLLSQRHKGQSLQSTTPSTLSGRRLWMSFRLRLLFFFSCVATQAFHLIADSLV